MISENDLAWAFPTNIPITPGHTLVIPKRCVTRFEDLTSEEKIAIFELTDTIKKGLRMVCGAYGFNHAWNEGEKAGQSVPHFHLHIVPRTEGDSGIYGYEPRDFLYRPGSRAQSPQEELVAVALKIRAAIQN